MSYRAVTLHDLPGELHGFGCLSKGIVLHRTPECSLKGLEGTLSPLHKLLLALPSASLQVLYLG